MRPLVLETEAALLLLGARRVLNYTREAEKDGEVYHDLSRPAELRCGVKAKVYFEPTASGYAPIVTLDMQGQYDADTAQRIAKEILGAPARLREGDFSSKMIFERATL